MVMKKDGRKRDIKSKLVAAVCMLLVSCIMMVSSTYAWFTLSTAPEVTGITTAIGANGNLEMALIPYQSADGLTKYTTIAEALAAINPGVPGTDATVVQKNTYWGNLVDLSNEGYGLNKISLYPSKLGSATKLEMSSLLQIPEYGSDGRITGFGYANMNGIYSGTAFNEGGFGVRVVGTSSGMTEREKAYRAALAAGSQAANDANIAASQSMANGGTILTTLAMKMELDGVENFDAATVAELKAIYADMIAANGPITLIETAIKQYIAASYLASTDADATTYTNMVNTILATDIDALATLAGVTVPSAMSNMITKLTDMRDAVEGEISYINDLAAGATKSQMVEALNTLGAISDVRINGETVSYWTEKNEQGGYKNIFGLVSNTGGVKATMNGGIYKDMADWCGTVNATIYIENLDVPSMSVYDLNIAIAMTAAAAQNPVYLTEAKTAVMAVGFTGGTNDSKPISNYYGYIIDMGFRTNAADSYLQLQTDKIDRIYAENTSNEETMGGGSTMSFDVNSEGYSVDSLKTLMSCIRVVFFDPADGTVYGEARLDVGDGKTYTNSEGQLTAYLKMWDPTANDGRGGWKVLADGNADGTIVALEQNKAVAVSSLVYLDGENLTNADVAYKSDIKGTMNLQFSSSADLKPMEYDDLMVNGGNENQATTYAVTVPEGVTGEDKATANTAYTFTVGTGYTLGTVTVGGAEVTPTPGENGQYTIPADKVTGAIVINVTANT